MSSTSNCSDKLSREHYISKSILSQFGGLQVEGLPWQTSGVKSKYGINSLTSKVLCTRHNSALSPLDYAAGHAFQQISDAMTYATKKSLARRTAFYLISGDALELWGVKTLLGLYAAQIASLNGVALSQNMEINYRTACNALSGAGLVSPLGMYIHPGQSNIGYQIAVSPLSSPSDGVASGLRVNMCGVDFEFIVDQRGGDPRFFEEQTFFRPWILDFNGPHRTARVILTWALQRTTVTRVNLEISRSSHNQT